MLGEHFFQGLNCDLLSQCKAQQGSCYESSTLEKSNDSGVSREAERGLGMRMKRDERNRQELPGLG